MTFSLLHESESSLMAGVMAVFLFVTDSSTLGTVRSIEQVLTKYLLNK